MKIIQRKIIIEKLKTIYWSYIASQVFLIIEKRMNFFFSISIELTEIVLRQQFVHA